MALINCTECNKEISDKAKICPGCGAPVAIAIGTSKKIGNLEIAEKDFITELGWVDANKACSDLGDGWRLPSTNELNILYENISSIGGFKGILYWSNQNTGDDRAYALNLKFGTKKDWKKDNVFNVRAVRTIK